MTVAIAIIEGHPDPSPDRLCRALADAYANGAEAAGHTVARVRPAEMSFDWLRTAEAYHKGQPPAAIQAAQDQIMAAQHLVFVYPLWMGTMPALMKAFLEQTFRPGFVTDPPAKGGWPTRPLAGRSARLVVTMGMPALLYRWFYRAHSLKSLERNVLKLIGIKPVRETLLGGVDSATETTRQDWLTTMRQLGRAAR